MAMDPRFDLKYRPQDPSVLIQHNEDKKRRIRNSQNKTEGSYGVSIRVQGIDGHPFIVLNNKEGHASRNNASMPETDRLSQSRSVLNSRHSQNSCRDMDEDFPENPYKPVSNASNKANYVRSEKGTSEFKEGSLKTNLFNFQRHPELLKPYDPNGHSVDIDNYKTTSTLTSTLALSPTEKEKPNVPNMSLHKNAVTKNASTNLMDVKDLSIKKENQEKSPIENTSILSSTSDNCTSESFTSSNGSPYSPNFTTTEPRKTKPDVLQFRRQDSAGPVLEGSRSRRSSCSSTTATSSQSLQKFWLEEQEDAIYADNVNRHENRRYIPFIPGTGRDIDTGCIPGVDELIEKFDSTIPIQRRGRSAKRNRINPEDRKRARSVDSALPFGLQGNTDYLNEFSRNLGKSNEHLLRPSQICQQKSHTQNYKLPFKRQNTTENLVSHTASCESANRQSYSSLPFQKDTKSNRIISLDQTDSVTLPRQGKSNGDVSTMTSTLKLQNRIALPSDEGNRKVNARNSGQSAQVTPDLLKGQQQLSQQTSEETAKQILFNYLKEGSHDNDDATKRKVNLVFEKIQTLKSRASSSSVQAPDPTAEIKLLSDQKNELEKKVVTLQRQLDEQMKNQESNKEEKFKTKANLKDIEQQLERSMDENLGLRGKLGESEKELRKHLEELFELKMEQEQYQTEIRDLQEQLSEMHDELDNAKRSVVDDGEREALIQDLMHMKQGVQELLMAREEQEDLLKKRERELTALKGALKEEVSSHDQEIDKLREQYEKELKKMRESLEDAVKNTRDLSSQKHEADDLKAAYENRAKSLLQENEELKQKIQKLEFTITELHQTINELNEDNDRIKERLKKTEKEKQQLAEALDEAKEQEREALEFSRGLENQLEDTKRSLTRISHEHHQLSERLKDESNQKEQLRNLKNEMESERWQLDKTIDRLQKEVSEHVEFSRMSTVELQKQFDEYKEKNRRDNGEMQRQLKDKILELERCNQTIRKLQEEVRHLEENLQDHQRAHDESMTKHHLLQQTIKDLQYELDAKNHMKEDRSKQVKSMEDKIAQLELELDEEKNNSDLLLERITRCREQIEQMRGELLQERGARQDLECDKMSLERQYKDLKSRIAHLETSHRSNKEGLVAQMEGRIAELEERLENEERDRASLQLNNRRLERKVKELMMQVDDEHLTLTDQKDQLSLRLKSMKRQVEEAEEEIDRLESAKKKLQRDLEDQVDINEQLQAQLTAAKKELSRRRCSPSKMLNDLDDDDDLSTDGESLYESHSVYRFSRDDGITA